MHRIHEGTDTSSSSIAHKCATITALLTELDALNDPGVGDSPETTTKVYVVVTMARTDLMPSLLYGRRFGRLKRALFSPRCQPFDKISIQIIQKRE